MLNFLTEAKKTLITALGFIVLIGGEPLLTEALHWLPAKYSTAFAAVVGVATIALNYLAPNETTDVKRAVGRSVRVKGQKPLAPVEAA
jgi:hypothetical protein